MDQLRGGATISGYLALHQGMTQASLAGNLSLQTINNLTPTALTDGFSIAGGTTSRTLTIAGANKTINGTGTGLTLTGAYNLTLTMSAATSLTLPTSGTVATTSNKLNAFASTTSAELASVISNETGSGNLVFATSPTLVTPNIGAATATSINGYTITHSTHAQNTDVGTNSTTFGINYGNSVNSSGIFFGGSVWDGAVPYIRWNQTNARFELYSNSSASTLARLEVGSINGYTIAHSSHARAHTITSTSDHSAGAWKTFYSNSSGNIIELANGASGYLLTSNGTSAAPSWAAPYSHPTQSAITSDNSNGVVIQDISVNTLGHITSVDTVNLDGRYYTETESDAKYATKIHNFIDTTNHPVTGLTAGHILRATGATTYGFGALQASDIPSLSYLPSSGGTLTGDLIISADNTDKFITFLSNSSAKYDWRIGYLGTGSGDANYLVFQTSGSGTFENALRIGLITKIAEFSATPTVSGTAVALSDHTQAVDKGGTNLTSYTVGDLVYASGATILSKLADVATGNVLLSGGVGAAPSYGKVGLTTHVSGTLAVSNGGTGATTLTDDYLIKGNGTSAVSASVVYDTGTNVGIGTTTPGEKLDVVGVVKTSEGFKTGTFHIVYDEQSSCLNFCVN